MVRLLGTRTACVKGLLGPAGAQEPERSLQLRRFPHRFKMWSSTMPAKSAAQQKAAGAALAAKRGEIPVSELKGASKSMYESMTEQELEEYASTKREGKPQHVDKPSK
jgi:hypothetical protein